jgi:translation initiation factor IF-2
MARTRVINLAKELKVDVRDLLQRMKDELGLQVDNYLSSLDETTVDKVRGIMSQLSPQVEELRIGDNVKRRRRVAPVVVTPPAAPPPEEGGETAQGEPAPKPPEKAPKARKPKETKARVVSLPPQEKAPAAALPSALEPGPEPAAPQVKAAKKREKLQKPAAAAPPEASAPEAAPGEPAAPKPLTSPVLKRARKPKKKDIPARIISLPPEAPTAPPPPSPAGETPSPARPAARAGRELRPAPAAEVKPVPADEKKAAEAKPKKKTKREVVEVPARSKPVKKREVRERADLYAEGQVRGGPGKRRGLRKAVKKVSRAELTVPKAIKRRVKVGESITVGELAKRMGIKSSEIIKQLLSMGVMATINYPIDYDAALLVAGEFGFEVERATMLEEDLLAQVVQEEGEMTPRPPVVTIMGHVDHGKTSLLDAIRQTRVTEGEAGGITQHIGAYHVTLPDGRGDVVFLDTPGHEAFTAMRARGAQVTDLVVLVVAADDGVMEQTVEAINHAKAAGVPLVVAVNKIDKANANPDRVKRELANIGVVSEDWGGDVLLAEVSAKQKIGIEELLEKILLQAEILELKAPRNIPAQGRIVESRLDKGRGPMGTVLVQKGMLKPGNYFVCGTEFGRVRAMFDDLGNRLEEASPGMPVEVQGFSGVPEAGNELQVLEDERKAKQIAMMRQQKQREAGLARISKVSLERLYQQIKEGAVKELKMVLKADVHGSIEALTKSLSELGNEEIKVNVIHTGIGEVTESDIMLASASDAIVVGFNLKANPKAQTLAEIEQVDVRFYDIIYNLLHDVHAALEGMLEPIIEERVLGQAEVRQVFSVSKIGTVAGCMVVDGKVERNALGRVKRGGRVVIEGGKITSLKRFKEDAKEVVAGYECGIGIDRFSDFQAGDIIEAYAQEKVKAQLASPATREAKE